MSSGPHTPAFALPALRSLGDLADAQITLVVDQREHEQSRLLFTRLPSVRGTLYSGDYSIRGLEDLFSCEKKGSLDELVSMVTTERERFTHELHRLRGMKFK